MPFTKVVEGSDTFHVEDGFGRTDLDHVWKEKLDKKSDKTFYVNQGTSEKLWKLPSIGGKEKKAKSSSTASNPALSAFLSPLMPALGSQLLPEKKKKKSKKEEDDEGEEEDPASPGKKKTVKKKTKKKKSADDDAASSPDSGAAAERPSNEDENSREEEEQSNSKAVAADWSRGQDDDDDPSHRGGSKELHDDQAVVRDEADGSSSRTETLSSSSRKKQGKVAIDNPFRSTQGTPPAAGERPRLVSFIVESEDASVNENDDDGAHDEQSSDASNVVTAATSDDDDDGGGGDSGESRYSGPRYPPGQEMDAPSMWAPPSFLPEAVSPRGRGRGGAWATLSSSPDEAGGPGRTMGSSPDAGSASSPQQAHPRPTAAELQKILSAIPPAAGRPLAPVCDTATESTLSVTQESPPPPSSSSTLPQPLPPSTDWRMAEPKLRLDFSHIQEQVRAALDGVQQQQQPSSSSQKALMDAGVPAAASIRPSLFTGGPLEPLVAGFGSAPPAASTPRLPDPGVGVRLSSARQAASLADPYSATTTTTPPQAKAESDAARTSAASVTRQRIGEAQLVRPLEEPSELGMLQSHMAPLEGEGSSSAAAVLRDNRGHVSEEELADPDLDEVFSPAPGPGHGLPAWRDQQRTSAALKERPWRSGGLSGTSTLDDGHPGLDKESPAMDGDEGTRGFGCSNVNRGGNSVGPARPTLRRTKSAAVAIPNNAHSDPLVVVTRTPRRTAAKINNSTNMAHNSFTKSTSGGFAGGGSGSFGAEGKRTSASAAHHSRDLLTTAYPSSLEDRRPTASATSLQLRSVSPSAASCSSSFTPLSHQTAAAAVASRRSPPCLHQHPISREEGLLDSETVLVGRVKSSSGSGSGAGAVAAVHVQAVPVIAQAPPYPVQVIPYGSPYFPHYPHPQQQPTYVYAPPPPPPAQPPMRVQLVSHELGVTKTINLDDLVLADVENRQGTNAATELPRSSLPARPSPHTSARQKQQQQRDVVMPSGEKWSRRGLREPLSRLPPPSFSPPRRRLLFGSGVAARLSPEEQQYAASLEAALFAQQRRVDELRLACRTWDAEHGSSRHGLPSRVAAGGSGGELVAQLRAVRERSAKARQESDETMHLVWEYFTAQMSREGPPRSPSVEGFVKGVLSSDFL